MPRKRRPKRRPREPANDPGRQAARSPSPDAEAATPRARPGDAARIVELIDQLGHPIDEKRVRRNLAALEKGRRDAPGCDPRQDVVGLIGLHRMVAIHRDAPVGRIPILVVAEEARGDGIGRMLVEAAERWCRKQGCRLIEVTSNDRRAEAHAFYRHLGYERTSIRFFKKLQ